MMNRTKQEDNFSNNVIWYNYILCILVIFIHARNDGIFTVPVWISGIPVLNELEAFLASDVAGAAVGGFYLSSGYIFSSATHGSVYFPNIKAVCKAW